MQGHSLSRIHRRLLRQRPSRSVELLVQSRTHLQHSTSGLHRSMARPTRSRTRNLSLGPLVQHKPPSPRPGRNHTATSRKQIHNNTKESGLKIPTQNPGLDTTPKGARSTDSTILLLTDGVLHPIRWNPPNRANPQSTPPCSRTTPIRWNHPDGGRPPSAARPRKHPNGRQKHTPQPAPIGGARTPAPPTPPSTMPGTESRPIHFVL